jgi:hypothetical protein
MSRPTARFGSPYAQPPLNTQALPFRVRIAQGIEEIRRVCRHRGEAYSRHQPDLVKRLSLFEPEADDLRDDVVLVMAESHETGEIVGSLRLSTNLNSPLRFEKEFELPPHFHGKCLAEAGRMVAQNGPQGRMVVPALVKVSYEVCFRTGIDALLLIARPPIDRMYAAMQFEDVFGERVITSAQPGVPVTLFFMDTLRFVSSLQKAGFPLHGFLAETHHPDIDIDPDFVHERFNVPHEMRVEQGTSLLDG